MEADKAGDNGTHALPTRISELQIFFISTDELLVVWEELKKANVYFCVEIY